MERNSDVILYIVELAYGDQTYAVTSASNPRHLQLRTPIPLWHKENMINLGVRKLLPRNWRAFAWIDADVEFKNRNWARETLRLLNGKADLVHLFDKAILLNEKNAIDEERTSVVKTNFQRLKFVGEHSGFCWAITRTLYEKLGGLFEYGILGGGDAIMCVACGCDGNLDFFERISSGCLDVLNTFREKARGTTMNYLPGEIVHYYHGSSKNRKYLERWGVLQKHRYDPHLHITKDAQGILVPTPQCPVGLLTEIMQYFWERNEDEDTFPGRPTMTCPVFLQSVADENTAASSLQCNDSQSQVAESAPQYETTPDIGNYAVPDCDATSADTPDSKNEHATQEELECEHDYDLGQTSSIV